MESLIRDIVERFKADPSQASLTLSYLPNGKFYASICRYLQGGGRGKQVVCSAQGETLESCIDALHLVWGNS